MSLKRRAMNLSIRNKLSVAFVVILALVGGLGFAALDRLSTLSSTVESLTNDSMAGLNELSGMRQGLLRYRLAVARFIAGGDVNPDFDKAADQALTSYREHDAKYAPTVGELEEQKLYSDIRSNMQAYLDAAVPVVSLYHAGKAKEAWSLYLSNGGIIKGEAVDATLSRDIQYNIDVAGSLTAQARQDYRSGFWVVVGLLTAVICLAAGIAYVLVRSVAHPLVQAAEVIGQLASHNYAFAEGQNARGDEIGTLFRSMDTLRHALQEADRLAAEQKAAQGCKATSAGRHGTAHAGLR